jgi:hypothetical protein
MIDYAISGTLLAALVAGLLQPVLLWPITRIPAFRERNPTQFLLSVVLVLLLWIVAIVAIPATRPSGAPDILVGLFAVLGAALFWLEVWGLMSRGYTLSILIALLEAGRPLQPAEIAMHYRGGDGLAWILQHRLGGLVGSGSIMRDGDTLTLTPRGMAIAQLYRLCIALLGLRKTG